MNINQCIKFSDPLKFKLLLLGILVLPAASLGDEIDIYLQINCFPNLNIFEVRRFEVQDMFLTELYEKDSNGKLTGKKNTELLTKHNLVLLDAINIECKLKDYIYKYQFLAEGSFNLLEDDEVVLEGIYFRYSNVAPQIFSVRIAGYGYRRDAEIYYRPIITQEPGDQKMLKFFFDKSWYRERERPKSMTDLNPVIEK